MNTFSQARATSGRRIAGRCLAAFMIGLFMAPVAALGQEAEPAGNSEQGTVSSEQENAQGQVNGDQVGGQESEITNQELGETPEMPPPAEAPAEPATGSEQQPAGEQESGGTDQESGAAPEVSPPTETPASPPDASDTNGENTDTAVTPPEILVATSTPEAGQETENPQTTIGGDDLIATTDPTEATTTEGELGIADSEQETLQSDSAQAVSSEQATVNGDQGTGNGAETSEQRTVNGEQTPEPPTPTPIASPIPLLQPESPPSAESNVVATLSRESLKPKPEYTLGVVGTVIAAKAKPRWQVEEHAGRLKDASPATITTEPTLAPDSENGALVVSGPCRLAYFVVMLYRNPDDYDRDPASYIVNKAFPCEGGSYSYTLSDLPKNLDEGTYYLLVAEQGDSGPWRPITGVVPVTIAPHP